MLKNEFLEMMRQDLKTKNDEQLNSLLSCFEEILKEYPQQTEIDSTKNIEDCYKEMFEYAQKNRKGNSYCFVGENLKTFILKYLNLKRIESSIIRLEDFI